MSKKYKIIERIANKGAEEVDFEYVIQIHRSFLHWSLWRDLKGSDKNVYKLPGHGKYAKHSLKDAIEHRKMLEQSLLPTVVSEKDFLDPTENLMSKVGLHKT